MSRTNVILKDTPPNRSLPVDTGRAALICIPDRGNFDPQVSFRSHQAAESEHGPRPSWSTWWDWSELYFRESGGGELYVIPVRGPAAAKATANIAGTGTTLIIDADSVGEWGNGAAGGLSYEVINGPINGATHRVVIIRLGGVEVARTPEFNTQAGGAFVSEHATIRLGGGTGLPTVIGNTNLAAGTLDRLNITQTQIDAAIDSVPADLGPMQIAAPDWQTEATHEKILAHSDPVTGRNRFAACDASPSALTESPLKAAAALVQGHASGSAGAFMGPWATVQPSAPGGTGRNVPASAFFCAKCAQVDRDAGPGQAPAGQYGQATSSLVTGLAATLPDDFTIAERDAAGVNALIMEFGGVKFDGNRTLVAPTGNDSEWLQIGVARLRMAVIARLKVAGSPFEHITLTRMNIARFDAALDGQMLSMADNFFPADDGSDPGYVVDTSEAVNTPASIAAGLLKAAVGFRPAPGADMVTIELTAVGVAAPLA